VDFGAMGYDGGQMELLQDRVQWLALILMMLSLRVLLQESLILSLHLLPDLQSGLFPLGFSTKMMYAFLISFIIHATNTAYFILVSFTNNNRIK
jgi:hypothetical protein